MGRWAGRMAERGGGGWTVHTAERPPINNTHQAQWSVLDDTNLARPQKGHAIRWSVLERHQRSYSALRDDHAGRDGRPVGAGARRVETHDPPNATAKSRRCVAARGCGGACSLA